MLEDAAEENMFVPAYMTGCKVAGPLIRLPEIDIARWCGILTGGLTALIEWDTVGSLSNQAA